jgi:hypothetical protein
VALLLSEPVHVQNVTNWTQFDSAASQFLVHLEVNVFGAHTFKTNYVARIPGFTTRSYVSAGVPFETMCAT